MNYQQRIPLSKLAYGLAGLLTFLPLLHGQSPSLLPPISVTSAPGVLPSTATSDPAAIKALQGVIEASGGVQVWSQIRSAKIRLSIAPMGAPEAHRMLMIDDWSSDLTLYRRRVIGSARVPHDHNGQAQFNSADTSKQPVPEFDQARVLAGSLPAAAAGIILKKPSYLAKEGSGTRCSGDMMCIDIYRQPAPNKLFEIEEEWLISRSSGLPTVIDLRLPNLIGQRAIYQEFIFQQTSTQDGIQFPSTIEMRHPSGSIQIRTVISFLPNARFDTAAFDKEASE